MRALRIALVALLASAGLSSASPPALAADAAAVGSAVDFSLRNLDGQQVSLSSYRGKVVLVNFWATWCGPCQVEMPHLQKIYTELSPQGLVILGISADDPKLDAAVKPLVKSKGLTYPILRDPDTRVVSQFNPSKTLPFNVLVGKDGKIAAVHAGYNPGDEVALRAELLGLLAK